MKNREELSLKELREHHPQIKATSRKVFLEKLDELAEIEVEDEIIFQNEDTHPIGEPAIDHEITKMLQDRRELLKYLLEEGGKIMSVLVVLPEDAEKVDVYNTMKFGLESWKLNEMAEGRTVTPFLFRDRMFEIHIGGKTYVKFACSTMKDYYERKQNFTVLKDLR